MEEIIKTPIYPLILVEQQGDGFELRTILRKEYLGNWHKVKFVRRYQLSKEEKTMGALLLETQRLHEEVYYWIICGTVVPESKIRAHGEEEAAYPLDNDQTSETLRINKLLGF